jgi:hypothetical protein
MPAFSDLLPVRRPAAWNGVSVLDLLTGAPPKFLLGEQNDHLAGGAARRGVKAAAAPPPEVVVIEGAWPGIRLTSRGSGADAGPTGAPWIDANYWRVQLARSLHPDKAIWVSAALPQETRFLTPDGYVLTTADAAICGGRWIVELHDALAREIAGGNTQTWKRIEAAARFFNEHREWVDYQAEASLGVVSDFTGENEFLAAEILNLTARQRQPFRVVLKSKLSEAALGGLKAVVYADAQAPQPAERKLLLAFAGAGGVVIAGPAWGASKKAGRHPRFGVEPVGKGRIAVASKDFDDPYLIASDAQILMSHRHDPVRFWNSGSLGSYYAVSADGRKGVLHLVNFAHFRKEDPSSVWFARPFKTARWWRLDGTEPQALKPLPQNGGVELHLPPAPVYAAIELEG